MIVVSVVVTLIVLAAITQAGVWLIERRHPLTGQMIDVAGSRLRVIDIGPKDSALPPVVLLTHAAHLRRVSMADRGQNVGRQLL